MFCYCMFCCAVTYFFTEKLETKRDIQKKQRPLKPDQTLEKASSGILVSIENVDEAMLPFQTKSIAYTSWWLNKTWNNIYMSKS